MPEVKFEVTSAAAYWLVIDGQSLPTTNDKAAKTLPTGPHALVWKLTGNGGDAFSVTIKAPRHADVKATGAIPASESHGLGYQIFDV